MAAEALLQYLWEHRLWEYGALSTVDGRPLRIIDPGRRNTDAGPDFFNAKVNIDGHDWAGNVEIHTIASDWYRHGHHNDPAYHSVMLHVVGNSDCEVHRPDGSVIPQVRMAYTPHFRERYDAMVNNPSPGLACAADLTHLQPLYFTDWVTSLGHERLYSKVERVEQAVQRLDGNWPAAAFVTLARALGFSTNSDPFERLAFATPLQLLKKHGNDTTMIEAALLGMAGFLDDCPQSMAPDTAQYMDRARSDFKFFCLKYGLKQPESMGWKMSRMRPPNFPHRRIAALAAMVATGFDFGREFAHADSLEKAREMFRVEIGGYWLNHYNFGSSSSISPHAFSPDTVDLLIINTVVPLLYAYGLHFGDDSKTEAAVDILHSLPAERNSLTRLFTDLGIRCDDAFTSQALIQLRRAYCEPRKCLYCRIGHRFLAARVRP